MFVQLGWLKGACETCRFVLVILKFSYLSPCRRNMEGALCFWGFFFHYKKSRSYRANPNLTSLTWINNFVVIQFATPLLHSCVFYYDYASVYSNFTHNFVCKYKFKGICNHVVKKNWNVLIPIVDLMSQMTLISFYFLCRLRNTKCGLQSSRATNDTLNLPQH